MAMSFSSGCVPFNGFSSTETPSLIELLPKTARPLAVQLSVEEREVLTYLILFGLHIQLLKGALPPSSRTLWKPWKSSNTTTSSAFSNPKLNSQHGASFSDNCNKTSLCVCFACYSSYWEQWNSSSNRNIISDIIEMVEMQDKALIKASKSNRKKKSKQQSQEKSIPIPAKAPKVKQKKAIETSEQLNSEKSTLENGYIDKNPSETAKTPETTLNNTESSSPSLKLSRRARKAMESKKESVRLTEVKNETMPVLKTEPMERVSEVGAKPDTNEKTESPSLHLTLSQNKSQQHKVPKRKNKQVMPMPLDYEEFEGVDEVDLDKNMLSRSSSSPRVADTNLSGRGFLARVFPDALGGVASRLWDLVSLRLRSRTMDYY